MADGVHEASSSWPTSGRSRHRTSSCLRRTSRSRSIPSPSSRRCKRHASAGTVRSSGGASSGSGVRLTRHGRPSKTKQEVLPVSTRIRQQRRFSQKSSIGGTLDLAWGLEDHLVGVPSSPGPHRTSMRLQARWSCTSRSWRRHGSPRPPRNGPHRSQPTTGNGVLICSSRAPACDPGYGQRYLIPRRATSRCRMATLC
jgi:hypothetical protein